MTLGTRVISQRSVGAPAAAAKPAVTAIGLNPSYRETWVGRIDGSVAVMRPEQNLLPTSISMMAPPTHIACNGDEVAVANLAGMIELLRTSERVFSHQLSSACLVLSLQWMGSGQLIVALSNGRVLSIGRYQSEPEVLIDFGEPISAFTLDPDTGQMCAGTLGGNVIVATVGNRQRTVGQADSPILATAILPRSRGYVGVSLTHRLWVFDSRRRQRSSTQSSPSAPLASVIDERRNRLLVSCADQRLHVWDLSSLTPSATSAPLFGPMGALALDASVDQLVIGGPAGAVNRAELERLDEDQRGHVGGIWSMCFLGDGKLLASAGADGMVYLWNLDEERVERKIRAHDGWVNSLATVQDSLLLSASSDGFVKTWDIETGDLVQAFRAHDGWVNSVAASAEGDVVVTGSSDRCVKLWSGNTGRLLRTISVHRGWVNAVAITADGQHCFSASSDGTVRSWHPRSRVEPQIVHQRSGAITSIAVTADAKIGFAAGYDGRVIRWSQGEECTVFDHGVRSWMVATTPTGSWTVSTGADGRTAVVPVSGATEVHRLDHVGTACAVTSSAFRRDLRVACAERDGRITVLTLPGRIDATC